MLRLKKPGLFIYSYFFHKAIFPLDFPAEQIKIESHYYQSMNSFSKLRPGG
jgi:hypothetical protein